ncbi:MAG TPA: tRNA lysidine(34) synthetase TilS [Chloroflexota bacterium]|nr:tRNA lysidine(34) synthetase TilS [Chloroflexota bacterium]
MEAAEPILLASVAAFCRKHSVFRPSETVLAAVSGGADSLCLLHCLHRLAPRLGVTLRVAHVHHGLRGAEADDDADFVSAEAGTLHLPCDVARVDAAAYAASHRCSIETAAREVRYAALREIMTRVGAACVATGHTEDDQAETLLLHLLRGSGLDGLAGMRARRADIARPLLTQSRQATVAFCAQAGLSPRHDRSNDDRAFRRNAVQADLLPALAAFNPQARRALARCAGLLAVDADYLRSEARAAFETLVPRDEPLDGLALARTPLSRYPDAVRVRILRLAIEQVFGGGAALSARMMAVLDHLAIGEDQGGALDIGKGFRAERRGEYLHLFHPDPGVPLVETRLPIPGKARFGDWWLEATVMGADEARASLQRSRVHPLMEVVCDRLALGSPVIIRSRKPGDRLRPLGLGGSKKVQDILVDHKVARAARDQIPLVVGPSGIAWIVGVLLDARAAVTARTSEAVRMRATSAETPSDRTHSSV